MVFVAAEEIDPTNDACTGRAGFRPRPSARRGRSWRSWRCILTLAWFLPLSAPSLAQGAEEAGCASDREKLEALLKAGDANLVRLFLGSLACQQVREEGQRWLSAQASAGDSLETARDLGHPANGDTALSDRVGADNRARYYKITTSDVAIIDARLRKAGPDLALAILDAYGTSLHQAAEPEKSGDYLASVARPAGVYFIVVKNDKRVSASYDLVLNLIEPAPPSGHPDIAYGLAFGPSGAEFRANFAGAGQFRYATFDVPRSGLYKFTSRVLNGDPGVDIDIRLHRPGSGGGWVEIARAERGPGEDEAMVEKLAPGRYLLQLYRDAGVNADVLASISPTMEVLSANFDGREVARNGDWRTMVRQKNGKTSCYSFTLATSFSPSDWRGVRPFLLLRVDPGEVDVFHTLDKARYYDARHAWLATVSGNLNFTIPVMVNGSEPDLKSLEVCGQDKKMQCVSNRGLQGLTQGLELTIKGTSDDGRPTTVKYSLQGYRASVDAMNRACNNETHTGWLIK